MDDITEADRIAHKLARRYPNLDREDVLAAARLGLVDAANRYTEQGRRFWVYAYLRIEGEIHDLARRHDPATIPIEEWHAETCDDGTEGRILIRTVFAHLSDLSRAVLAGYYLRGQTQGELAQRLGVSETRISQVRRQALAGLRKRLRPQHA